MKKKIKQAQANYLKTKAEYEAIKEADEQARAKVLAENLYYDSETGERITKPSWDFMIAEDIFMDYLHKVHEEHIAQGLPALGVDESIEYPFWQKLRQAEDELIDISIDLVPSAEHKKTLRDSSHIVKFRDQLLNLALKLDTRTIPNNI